MQAIKIELLIVNFDGLDLEEIKSVIENTRYPNHCISPQVMSAEVKEIGDWDDDHLLNDQETCKQEFNRLFKPKYLKVMADYSSTGLWRADGCNVDPENYNLSAETLKLLMAWCDLYEYNDDYLDPNQRKQPTFDIKTFSEQGLQVSEAIKKDLPDYMIVYFDETTHKLITIGEE
jgi:hypothetical protein